MQSAQNRSLLLHRTVAPALLVVAVCLWNWPVFAGRQPAGGDVTTFFSPLMTSYARSLAEGQWPPLWDDHWGYGFPALAESQMGVFYPPHILLFGVLAPATAYSINLLLHVLLAALFAYLAGRTLGLGPMGAGLCGLVFFAGDFFTIHAPHQWAPVAGFRWPSCLRGGRCTCRRWAGPFSAAKQVNELDTGKIRGLFHRRCWPACLRYRCSADTFSLPSTRK
jgi:hypothetical protein